MHQPKVYLWRIDQDLLWDDGSTYLQDGRRTVIGRAGDAPSKGSLVLLLGDDGEGVPSICAAGEAGGQQAVSTGRRRVTLLRFRSLSTAIAIPIIESMVDRHVRRAIEAAWEEGTLGAKLLTRRSGGLLVDAINRGSNEISVLLEEMSRSKISAIVNPRRLTESQDAASLAVSLSGVNPSDLTEVGVDSHSPVGAAISRSFFVQDVEDDMLADDFRRFDSDSVIRPIASSAALVEDRDVRLLVVNVNRKRLENVHGVDLVYYDLERDMATVVQYKRLTRKMGKPWKYTNVGELNKQLHLMDLQDRAPAQDVQDWRLSPSPHFFKFMKDVDYTPTPKVLPGMYVSAEYLMLGLRTKAFLTGPKGGFQVSYNNCAYLPTAPFVEMVKRGLIGTSSLDKPDLLNAVREMATSRQVVLALRSKSDG